jgi:hypothetical protein
MTCNGKEERREGRKYSFTKKKKIKIKNHLLRKGIRRIAQKILYTIFFAFHTQSGGIYAKRKSE